jgi:hypothetical protein
MYSLTVILFATVNLTDGAEVSTPRNGTVRQSRRAGCSRY